MYFSYLFTELEGSISFWHLGHTRVGLFATFSHFFMQIQKKRIKMGVEVTLPLLVQFCIIPLPTSYDKLECKNHSYTVSRKWSYWVKFKSQKYCETHFTFFLEKCYRSLRVGLSQNGKRGASELTEKYSGPQNYCTLLITNLRHVIVFGVW